MAAQPAAGAPAIQWQRETSGPSQAAVAYQRYLVPGLFQPSATALLELVPPAEAERVLDVGCGTGLIALLASAAVGTRGKVAAVDINPGMLAVARNLPGAERIEWQQADAHKLPYQATSFETVYCHHSLQFFSDRGQAVRDMRRVLVPGGRAGVAVWGPVEASPAYVVLGDSLSRHVAPEAGAAVRGGPFSLADGNELSAVLDDNGFDGTEVKAVEVTTRFPSVAEFLAGVLPLTAALVPAAAQITDAQVRLIIDEVGSELAYFRRDGELHVPMLAHLAVTSAA